MPGHRLLHTRFSYVVTSYSTRGIKELESICYGIAGPLTELQRARAAQHMAAPGQLWLSQGSSDKFAVFPGATRGQVVIANGSRCPPSVPSLAPGRAALGRPACSRNKTSKLLPGTTGSWGGDLSLGLPSMPIPSMKASIP